jgi:FtsP/CotA-like multicopper oxidase with cupredoxin domain
LSDIGTDLAGNLQDPTGGGDIGTLFGREGDRLLVNGRTRPTLTVRPGLVLRLRLVNTARSRYYQLALAGHRFRRIGGDGGLIEYPVDSDTVVLAPAERADVLLVPEGEPGSVLSVRWVAYDRGFGSTYNRPDEPVFYLKLAERAELTQALPTTSRTIEPLDLAGATPIDLRFTDAIEAERLVMGINDVPFSRAEPVRGALGETQVWSLTNEMDFAHPFHLHGFFFQVLDANDAPVRPLEWKDTVDVPVGQSRRIAVRYDERPGMWMFHCHILDHADAGMMGMLDLAEHATGHAAQH